MFILGKLKYIKVWNIWPNSSTRLMNQAYLYLKTKQKKLKQAVCKLHVTFGSSNQPLNVYSYSFFNHQNHFTDGFYIDILQLHTVSY